MEISEKTQFIRNLKESDKEVLLGIYQYRCLTKELISEFFFSKIGKGLNYTEYKLRKFIRFGLIEAVKYYGNENGKAYFLTPQGIQIIKTEIEVPEILFSRLNATTCLGIYKAAELKLNPKIIEHQIETARTSLTIQKEYFKDKKYLFFNDKYAYGRYDIAKPDGIIVTPSIDMFVEMDMNTEGGQRLKSKWTTYRQFMNSASFTKRENEIVVLFTLKLRSSKRTRTNTVISTLKQEIWDLIGNGIELYIGDLEDMKNVVQNHIWPIYLKGEGKSSEIPKILGQSNDGWGYKIQSGEDYKIYTSGTKFDFYAFKKAYKDDYDSIEETDKEFFVDSYIGSPVSVLKKLDQIDRIASEFKLKTNREFKYMVVLDNIKEAYLDMKAAKINPNTLQNVYFTTVERLKGRTFNEALFTFSGLTIRHFTDKNLQFQQDELTLSEK